MCEGYHTINKPIQHSIAFVLPHSVPVLRNNQNEKWSKPDHTERAQFLLLRMELKLRRGKTTYYSCLNILPDRSVCWKLRVNFARRRNLGYFFDLRGGGFFCCDVFLRTENEMCIIWVLSKMYTCKCRSRKACFYVGYICK